MSDQLVSILETIRANTTKALELLQPTKAVGKQIHGTTPPLDSSLGTVLGRTIIKIIPSKFARLGNTPVIYYYLAERSGVYDEAQRLDYKLSDDKRPYSIPLDFFDEPGFYEVHSYQFHRQDRKKDRHVWLYARKISDQQALSGPKLRKEPLEQW